jgi:hypothetical protein
MRGTGPLRTCRPVSTGSADGLPLGHIDGEHAGLLPVRPDLDTDAERLAISPETRTIVLVGFLGSFTTFSTFLFETDQMLEHAEWVMAGLNLTGQLGLGLAAYLLGVFLGRVV